MKQVRDLDRNEEATEPPPTPKRIEEARKALEEEARKPKANDPTGLGNAEPRCRWP